MTVVAIDGPAGSGKSTIAAALAERLRVPHVDTGAYYRAATLAALRAGADLRDPAACGRIAAAARIDRRAGRTLLCGQDVEEEIRGPQVTAAVSAVAAHPPVRAALLELQRRDVDPRGAVVEGRDAGTVVAPDARLKVWLTADADERAARRSAQVGRRGAAAVSEQVGELARRDALDAAQMSPAEDAVLVDTTGRAVESIVDELVARLAVAERPSQPGRS